MASLVTDEDTSLFSQMQTWRRTLHAHPETAFEEHQTAELVANSLKSFGIEVHIGIAKTGVVGVLRAGRSSRAIGLRADMDALHIQEENDFPHRSGRSGRMHACGHDGHTAMLLGAAKHLARTRRFDGTVYLIFQPAEENEGGGRRMVEEGLFSRFPMEAVYGLHNLPGVPVGQFQLVSGAALASFDTFEIRVRGEGGHAAMPHRARDPILGAAHLIVALQSIVSRALDPRDAGVVSVTCIHGGETWNVIPNEVLLRGSVRTLSDVVRASIEERLRGLTAGICSSFGLSATVSYERRYPPTVNYPKQAEQARRIVKNTFGSASLDEEAKPLMASEDFSYMLLEKPGCFALLGNGSGTNAVELHSPRYDFNDEVLGWGATYWVRMAEGMLGEGG